MKPFNPTLKLFNILSLIKKCYLDTNNKIYASLDINIYSTSYRRITLNRFNRWLKPIYFHWQNNQGLKLIWVCVSVTGNTSQNIFLLSTRLTTKISMHYVKCNSYWYQRNFLTQKFFIWTSQGTFIYKIFCNFEYLWRYINFPTVLCSPIHWI